MTLKKLEKVIRVIVGAGKGKVNFIYLFKANHKYLDKNSIHSARVVNKLQDRGYNLHEG